jgi:hypothetical protein
MTFTAIKALVATLPELVEAATAFLRFYPLRQLAQLENKLDDIEDEIRDIAVSDKPNSPDLLRLGTLAKRKGRVLDQIRFIRSTIHKAD